MSVSKPSTSRPSSRPLEVRYLGRQPYAETLALQRDLAERRGAEPDSPDTLLIVEHDPVFTLGRKRTSADNVLDAGDTPVVQVERGGDVTWHGPGQLVAYPIMALAPDERDVHEVLRRLESAIIELLDALGLQGQRRERFTGVWVDHKKVASIGIAVTAQWVTLHGVALNVSCTLEGFGRINPCGLASDVMTSVEQLGGRLLARIDLEHRAAVIIAAALGRDIVAEQR